MKPSILKRLLVVLLLSLLGLNAWTRGGGGCFLADTPILLGNGQSLAINQIHPGDTVRAFDSQDLIVKTHVRAVFQHQVDSYYTLSTANVSLQVTAEHPFYIGEGLFKTVASLKQGDVIYVFDGQRLTPQSIVNLDLIHAKTKVYNLQTDAPHTYFAAGIAVHNKGGGGGHSGGGGHYSGGHYVSGGGGNGSFSVLPMVILFGYVIYLILIKVKDYQGNLDYNYSRSVIERKSSKTLKMLNFIARQDQSMQPEALVRLTREVFLKLQDCWSTRDYTPMQPWLIPDLFAEHQQQIAGMVSNHEINHLAQLVINQIDLVNLRYTEKKDHREFTALITATCRDYYVDDRTNQYLRGDNEPETFQEFWTFQLQESGWKLREIEQSKESDYLKEENFLEQFTDGQIEKVYEGKVDKLGVAGPGFKKDVEEKINKVDRMLNFLVQSNRVWDRQDMLARVRLVFTQVHLALEAGELNDTTISELFPAVAAQFNDTMQNWRAQNHSIEYRNFCIRKVEIVLVRSFEHSENNEFTARISAHAQRIQKTKGVETYKDQDVTPFEEYWTFGLLDGQWKLKEALPKAQGSKTITTENTEEGSSPDLVKWYYTKKRAL